MALAFRLLLVVLVVAVVVVALRQIKVRPAVQCSTCKHCRKLFDDGTLCGYGAKETFKNSVHVQNCMDHQKS